jgi:Secretion system C-terminal sorting domain
LFLVYFSFWRIYNYIGVSHTANSPMMFNLYKFEMNDFYGDTPLLPPYTGQPATSAWAHIGMELSNSNFQFLSTNQSTFNYFHDLDYGVYMNKTLFYVTGGFYFDDIKAYSNPNTPITSPQTFEEGTAIYAGNQSRLKITPVCMEYILNNDIVDSHNGIVVKESSLTFTRGSFVQPIIAGVDNGIVIQNGSSKSFLIDNCVIGFASMSPIPRETKRYGIAVFDSPGMTSFVVNNVAITAHNAMLTSPTGANGTSGILISNSPQQPNATIKITQPRINVFGGGYGIAIRSSDYLNVFGIGQAGNFINMKKSAVNLAAVLVENSKGCRVQNLSPIQCWWPTTATSHATNNGIRTGLGANTEGVSPCGIHLVAADKAQICDNTIGNFVTDVFAQDACGTTKLYGIFFISGNYGVYFAESLVLSEQKRTLNTWYGPYETTGGKHRGFLSANNLLQGTFVTDYSLGETPEIDINTGLPSVEITNGYGVERWFIDDPMAPVADACSPILLTAPPTNPNNPTTYTTKTFDETVAEDGYELNTYDTEIKYWSKQQLYARLKKEPNLADSSAILQNFKAGMEISDEKTLFDIDKNKTKVYALNAQLVAAQTNINTLNDNYMNQLAAALGRDSSITVTDSVLLNNLQIDILAAVETEHNLSAQIKAERMADATDLMADNAVLSTTAQQVANSKLVNTIELNATAMANPQLGVVEIQNLQSVAAQCPLVGGRAVFVARALLAGQGFVTDYDNQAICAQQNIAYRTQPNATSPNPSKGGEYLRLFPNPANTNLSIQPQAANNASVTICDTYGRAVYTNTFNSHNLNISTTDWAAGVYIVQVTTNNETQVYKVNIIH